MEMRDGAKAPLYPIIWMCAQQAGCVRVAITCGVVHLAAAPVMSPLSP